MAKYLFTGCMGIFITVAAQAMSTIPRGYNGKSFEIFVLPSADHVEFAVFPGTTGLKHSYDIESKVHRVENVREMERRLAGLPPAKWFSF
jgi:hypothetical protein